MKKPLQKPAHPRWETFVMFVSFALLWAWLLSRISLRQAPNEPIGPFWMAIQIVAIIALLAIFVRRLARVRSAIKEVGEKQFGFVSRRKK